MSTVRSFGELSFIWFGGKVSHVITKRATFAGDALHFPDTYQEPTPEQCTFVQRALDTQPDQCLYARVDCMFDADGTMLLSELELTEPYLYLNACPGSAARYAAAIAAAAASSSSSSSAPAS